MSLVYVACLVSGVLMRAVLLFFLSPYMYIHCFCHRDTAVGCAVVGPRVVGKGVVGLSVGCRVVGLKVGERVVGLKVGCRVVGWRVVGFKVGWRVVGCLVGDTWSEIGWEIYAHTRPERGKK